jgi:hypothetical protein
MCVWWDNNHARGIERLMFAIETLIHVKNRNKILRGYHYKKITSNCEKKYHSIWLNISI